MKNQEELDVVIHKGGCHCGAVQFEVEAPRDLEVDVCNCSICAMSGYQHLIVKREKFRLVTPDSALSTYRFNSLVAEHYFCKVCGIKSFYVPRSNPTGISVNVRCLQPDTIASIRVTEFDGQNWETNAASLAHHTE